MIAYLIKSILCSGLLILAYHFFLEKETTHRFKRWYLLLTLPLALVIPLIHIELNQQQVPAQFQTVYKYVETGFSAPEADASLTREENKSSGFPWTITLVIGYVVIVVILLLRLFNNLLSILSEVGSKTTMPYGEAMLVLHSKHTVPYSFLKYIFISENDRENKQILLHELTHVRQRHSLDILIIELIHCVMWFNPAMIFYKRAIRLNHEFLADEVVIKNYPTAEYQKVLFRKAKINSSLWLTSSFNYSATKKRFIMMTTMKNKTRACIKITLSCLLLVCAALIFPKKIYAQDVPASKEIPPQVTLEQDGTGATAQMVTEFDSIIYKYMHIKELKTGKAAIGFNTTGITDTERTKMREIYNVMTVEQKAKYPAHCHMIFAPFTPPKKNPPTAQEFAEYADAAVYGVWLNGKRIANAELANYQPSDIAHVFKNRLLKNAAHYGQYKFHLDLMTQDYFEKTYPPKFK